MLAEGVALDRLGEDDGRLARVPQRAVVGGIHLAIVVTAALEFPPDVVVGPARDELAGPWIPPEEILADIGAVVRAEGLVIAVRRRIHEMHERALIVRGEQIVPAAAPDALDDVPARAAEEGLELLDDLAVAAHRPVEPLQVAVDDEGEVVELLEGGQLERTAALDLVHLAVAEERPDVLIGGVLDAAVRQVLVELRLMDRVERTEPHRDGRELPERRHEPRVGIGRQRHGLAVDDVALLLAEAVELILGQAALEEGARIHTGGGVPLEEDLVTAAGVVLPAEEVVHAHFVEGRRRRIRGDVPAHADPGALGAVHEHGGIPPQQSPERLLHVLVAGEPRLLLQRDRVDVVGRREGGDPDLLGARMLEQPQHEIAGALGAGFVEDRIHRLQPFLGLGGVDVRQIARQAVEDRGGVGATHGGSPFCAVSRRRPVIRIDPVHPYTLMPTRHRDEAPGQGIVPLPRGLCARQNGAGQAPVRSRSTSE